MTATAPAGDLVRRGLWALGVEAVYGRPLPGVPVVDVDAPDVAALLAEAHLLVHRSRCAVHDGGVVTVLDRSARPPVAAPPALGVDDPDGLVAVWREVDRRLRAPATAGAVALHLGLDPAAPMPDRPPVPPDPVDRWVAPDPDALERLAAARAPVALVGPGVADHARLPGLHALAAAADLGVLNTWGAKGVFDWRSRHHWATVGLQARDLELGGLAAADVVVAAGLDDREVPGGARPASPVVTVDPGALGPLAERWHRPRAELPVPPLRAGLAAVTQEGWGRRALPLAPTQLTRSYSAVAGPGGLVAADPGTAGYWVARTFPTTGLGGAVVPARAGAHGLAAACVAVARLRRPGRPALAVVDVHADADAGEDAVLHAATRRVIDAARQLGVAVPVEVWDPGGPALGPDAHAERLRSALAADRPPTLPVATDPAQLGRMIDVAGEIVAWQR